MAEATPDTPGRRPSRALFFPYIRMPDDAWTRKVLLYWDEVAAIIPEQVADDSDALDPFTSALLRQGIIRRRRPEVHAVGLPGFAENFLELVDREFGPRVRLTRE